MASLPKRAEPHNPPTGFVFYEGPSEIDGAPIVGLLTLRSTNRKTGPMIQSWILRQNVHPVRAAQTGSDRSVCGNCPMRGAACYVRLFRAPGQVWSAYKAGNYARYDHAAHWQWITQRPLRIGAYGEPPAIPRDTWRPILETTRGRSGYTHLWRERWARPWRRYVMASVHSEAGAREAQRRGWRTFRSRLESQDVLPTEVICPGSEEAASAQICYACGLCSGNEGQQPAGVTIIAHGAPSAKRALYDLHTQ